MKLSADAQSQWWVICLCAEWCGTCRDYRAGFEALQEKFPNVHFLWIDVEDDASWIGEIDVEDFPTILIQRNEWVMFYGTMLPQHSHLQRTLETIQAQTAQESHDYAQGNDERRAWQEHYNLRALLKAHLNSTS